jgi:hypothetical protein
VSDLPPAAVAITVATVTTPKPPSAGAGTYKFLAGAALFEVEQVAPDEFRYRLAVRTVPAGTSEAVLADWLTHHVSTDRLVIGWHLAETIVPALFEAADAASPAAAGDLINLLSKAITMDAEDLADRHGGMAAPAFREVCAEAGIPAWAMSDEETLGAWSIGRKIELIGMLATNAVAAWRLWADHEQPANPIPHRFAADALRHWRVDTAGGSRWQDGEISRA